MFARFRQTLRQEDGVSAIETIALTAVVIILMAAALMVFQNGGGDRVAGELNNGVDTQIDRWRGEDGGGLFGGLNNNAFSAGAGSSFWSGLAGGLINEAVETGKFTVNFVVAVAETLWDSLTGVVRGIWDILVLMPVTGDAIDFFLPGTRAETIANYQALIDAFEADRLGTLSLIVKSIFNGQEIEKAFNDGDYGRAIGLIVGQIPAVLKIGKLGKLANAIDKTVPDEIIDALGKLKLPCGSGARLCRYKYSPSVLEKMKRNAADLYHNFPAQLDDMITSRKPSIIRTDGRQEFLATGVVNKTPGVYHITLGSDKQTIIHRVFIPESDWVRYSRVNQLPGLPDVN